jgi:uncharacterized LabA/DUF88 family protein
MMNDRIDTFDGEAQASAEAPADQRLRTMVFVDYQNMYRSARQAFGWESEGGQFGNFRPYGLGRQMVRDPERVLEQVRIYSGIHTPQHNPTQHGLMQRRMSAWVAESPEKIEVFPRPLRYGRRGPEEKGVDVELAIDFVRLALDDAFDVGVLASGDTDLVPALKFVAERFPEKTLVTLGYATEPGFVGEPPPAPLDLAETHPERRFITKRDFDRIADKRNFYKSASDASAQVDAERWERIRKRYDS